MKRVTIAVVVVLLLVVGVLALYASMNSGTTLTNTTSNNSSNMNANNSTNSTAEETNSVSIANMAFSPVAITVKKGTTVTWTNNDTVTHTVTESDGKTGPNSGDLAPGKTYTFTFNETGTFAYKCTIHPSMQGTVTVQ